MITLILLSKAFAGALICNDGTQSPTCDVCSSGCCSSHGGCTSSYRSGVDVVQDPCIQQVGSSGRVYYVKADCRNHSAYTHMQEYTDQFFEPMEERLELERAQAQAAYARSQRAAQLEGAASLWKSVVARVGEENARMWLTFGTKPGACVVVAEASIMVQTSTGAILMLPKDERAILTLPDQSEFATEMAKFNQLAAIRAPICNEGEQ